MAETIDQLTVNYWDDGRLVRRELRKEVVAKGTWATVMYLLQELDRKNDKWGPARVSIVRYKKSRGEYRFQSRFNVTGEKQSHDIVAVLDRWFGRGGKPGTAPEAVADADAKAARGEVPTPPTGRAAPAKKPAKPASSDDAAKSPKGDDAAKSPKGDDADAETTETPDTTGGNSDDPPDF